MRHDPRLSLLAASCLAACATVGRGPAVSAPLPGERAYRSGSGSFDVDLPAKGWAVVGETPNRIRLQLQDADGRTGRRGMPVFLEVDARYLQPGEGRETDGKLAAKSVARYLRGFGQPVVAEEGPALVGGRRGFRLDLRGKTSGVAVQVLEATVRDGHRLYVVHLSGAEQLLGRALPAWLRAADSLVPHAPSGDEPPRGGAKALARAAERAATEGRDPAKAAAWLDRAVALAPHDGALRDRLLEADLSAGLLSRALDDLRGELRDAPERFDRWELLGALELQAGRPLDAIATWTAATARPGCPVELNKSLGALLLSQHRLPEAAAAFGKAVARAPRDAAAYAGLGEVYFKEGRLEEARKAEARAAELNPAEGEIHAVLSEIYGEMNRYPEAADECMAALERDISKDLGATLRYNLACYQARMGHERECLWWLRQALEAGFDDVQLMKTDPDLASVRGTPAFQQLLAP